MKKVQESLTATESSVLATLENFRFSSRTNITKKQISNHDAVCYILYVSGSKTNARLVHLLRIWRAQTGVRSGAVSAANMGQIPALNSQVAWAQAGMKLHFKYLFNAGVSTSYGFVGKDFHSESNELWLGGSTFGEKAGSERKTYWHRQAKGLYGCTQLGTNRGFELHAQVKGVLNVA